MVEGVSVLLLMRVSAYCIRTHTALCTDEGDPWNPSRSVVADLDAICEGVLHVLRPMGRFLSISFQQPHFRKKYLLGAHAGKQYSWDLLVKDIGAIRRTWALYQSWGFGRVVVAMAMQCSFVHCPCTTPYTKPETTKSLPHFFYAATKCPG